MAKLELDRTDTQSATWQKVEAYLKEQLAECREANDVQQDADKTAKLRGKIELIKDTLSQVSRETKEFKPVAAKSPA